MIVDGIEYVKKESTKQADNTCENHISEEEKIGIMKAFSVLTGTIEAMRSSAVIIVGKEKAEEIQDATKAIIESKFGLPEGE